jgi:hypothetical protein
MANADEEVDEFFVFRLELKLQEDVDEDDEEKANIDEEPLSEEDSDEAPLDDAVGDTDDDGVNEEDGDIVTGGGGVCVLVS